MNTWTRRSLAVAVVVAGLWGATAAFGPGAARKALLPDLRAAAIAQGGPIATDASFVDPASIQGTRYWVHARPIAPMLLLVKDGLVCGSLCASGHTSLYLWFPGGVKLLQVREIWAS